MSIYNIKKFSEIENFYKNKKSNMPFNDEVINMFDRVSKHILTNKKYVEYKDIFTFGFWCRRQNLLLLKKNLVINKNKIGYGVIFHVPPSNIPILAIYSLAFGMLTGNSNIIRVSKNCKNYIKNFIKVLEQEINKSNLLKNSNLFISYERDDTINEKLSFYSDARIIWGGDHTINKFKKFETNPKNIDLMFGDKVSFSIINTTKLKKMTNKEMINFVKDFYNDTFIVDQNACSSPSFVFWVGKKNKNIELFWDNLQILVKKNYSLTHSLVLKRFEYLNKILLENKNLKLIDDENKNFYRINLKNKTDIQNLRGFAGIFFEKNLDNLKKISKYLYPKIQTITYYGISNYEFQKLYPLFSAKNSIDRIIPIGRSLEIDFVWDGKNIYEYLTRQITLN